MENDLISRSALKDALEYWTNFPKHRGGKSWCWHEIDKRGLCG